MGRSGCVSSAKRSRWDIPAPRDWCVGLTQKMSDILSCLPDYTDCWICLSSCQWVGVCHQTPRDWHVGWQWPDASNVLYTKTFTWIVRCRASGSEFAIKPWETGTPARQYQWPDTNIVWYCVIYKDLNLRYLPSCQWVGFVIKFRGTGASADQLARRQLSVILCYLQRLRLKPEMSTVVPVGRVCHQNPRDWCVGWPNGPTPT